MGAQVHLLPAREAISADHKMPIFATMTGDVLQRTRLRRARGHWWWW
jgi:hypothetical protein